MRISDWSSDVCSSDLGILANAGLQVEIGSNCTAVECLDLSALEAVAERAFAFGFEPEAIDVAADKRLTIPTIAIASGTSLIFSQVEHHLVDSSPALLAHRFGAGTVHFRLRDQSIGIMIAWRRWRGCVAGGKRRPGARKSTRLNSSHYCATRMPPSA